MQKIIIGSRGSDLALWQANFVTAELQKLGVEVQLNIIKTKGDKIQNIGFDKLEGKGFFTKELEDALLSGKIDLAVHSHKDLPTTSPEGLIIAAVSHREDPAELLLIHPSALDKTEKLSLKKSPLVGTSSARRKSQLLSIRPDCRLDDLRGNVPTRIQKLRDGSYDAILLAAAGINRLNLDLSGLIVVRLDPDVFIPSPAQGVLGLQIRENDEITKLIISKLNDAEIETQIRLERRILNLFDGGCQLPLGVYCYPDKGGYVLRAAKAKNWNTFPVRIHRRLDNLSNSESVAQEVVAKINNLKPQRVFISKDLDEGSYFFRALTENNYTVNAKSFIKIQPLTFGTLPSADWIFFSSSNGVQNFFNGITNPPKGVKFAAMGGSTAEALKKYNTEPAFVGGNDVKETAIRFSELVKDQTILFPMAKESMRTVQQYLTGAVVKEIFTYETILNSEKLDEQYEVYVFTSPSNVQSFFKSNKIDTSAIVIAMGQSTEKTLRENGVENAILPSMYDEMGLAEAVFSW